MQPSVDPPPLPRDTLWITAMQLPASDILNFGLASRAHYNLIHDPRFCKEYYNSRVPPRYQTEEPTWGFTWCQMASRADDVKRLAPRMDEVLNRWSDIVYAREYPQRDLPYGEMVGEVVIGAVGSDRVVVIEPHTVREARGDRVDDKTVTTYMTTLRPGVSADAPLPAERKYTHTGGQQYERSVLGNILYRTVLDLGRQIGGTALPRIDFILVVT